MSTGPEGVQGFQGEIGSGGTLGATGIPGPTGPQGPVGFRGRAGNVGPTGATGGGIGSNVSLATYSLGIIANAVSANSATPTYIYQTAVPSAVKGKSGQLNLFFNMSNANQYATNQSFDYGVYVDGVSLSLGESNTMRYIQTAANTFALSSNGYSLGTGGMFSYFPLSVPVSFAPNAQSLQIGIVNSSAVLNAVQSVIPSPTVSTIVITVTTPSSYTVPSTAGGSNVIGVFAYMWGGGGGRAGTTPFLPGGSGGYTTGYYQCNPGTILYYNGAGGAAATLGGPGGAYCGLFTTTTYTAANCIAMAGGGGGAGRATTPNQVGGAGGGSNGDYGELITTCTDYTVYAQATQISGANSGGGTSQFLGSGGGSGGLGGGGGGWYGGGAVNGGSGYTGGFTSGGTTFVGSTFCQTTATPNAVLPAFANSPYYRSGYGHGSNGLPLLVLVPAVSLFPHYVGVNANVLTL